MARSHAVGCGDAGEQPAQAALEGPDQLGAGWPGVISFAGLEMLGVDDWPAGVPVQIHYALDDQQRRQEWADALVESANAAGAPVDMFDYRGSGHLFTDASLPKEYDPASAELLWERVVTFCEGR